MRLTQRLREKRGGVAILVGLCAIVLFGFVALVIDIGYGLVTRNELHNVADAAALAATRELGRIYMAMPEGARATYVLSGADGNDVRNEAINVALMNYAAGQSVTVDANDIEIGQWDMAAKTFTVGDAQPNAVRVTSRRDGTVNGPISTFFARIIGHDTLSVTANATAAISGPNEVKPGEMKLPIGIGRPRFEDPNYCDSDIQLSPTGSWEGCAGWMTFNEYPASSNNLKNIMDDMTAGTYTTPGGFAGIEPASTPHPPAAPDGEPACCVYTGGDVSSAFSNFETYFNTYATAGELESTVVVYDTDTCQDNPSGYMPIYGFATVKIYEVLGPPDNTIKAKIDCGKVVEGPSGGPSLGTIGSIPKLVQ